MISPLTLATFGYNENSMPVAQSNPTDVAAAPPIVADDSTLCLVLFHTVFQPGPGCTAVTIVFGLHHNDGSGGGTNLSALQVPVLAGETTKILFRMLQHNPSALADAGAAGKWGDASYRVALTQAGATGAGAALGTGIMVYTGRQL